VAVIAHLILPCAQALTTITDANIGTAVTAWVTSPGTAATTYGNIADWNTASVTSIVACHVYIARQVCVACQVCAA
jgi:hypothetical protein